MGEAHQAGDVPSLCGCNEQCRLMDSGAFM